MSAPAAAAPAAPPRRKVLIPERPQHEGFHRIEVELVWVCPVCGGPRGEPFETISYDGSLRLHCHGWNNPCDHIDKYVDCVAEAKAAQ